MKKKRSIKKALLSDGSERIEKKIAILGGSTTGDIADMLEIFLLDSGIQPKLWQSEYNAYWQDAVFGNEQLDEFAPDIIFIHTSNRNITEKLTPDMTKEQTDEALQRQVQHFITMWEKLRERFECVIIQNNFEPPLYRLLGNRDAYDHRGMTNFITRLNERFYEYAAAHDGFYINDINYLAASYGLEKWSAPLYWYMYKYALCTEAIPLLSFSAANIIKAILGKNKKALALDLDNTLWGGVVGDDGVEGIAVGEETPVAQGYREFQKYLKQLKSMGVMLTVCSKNDEENAIAGLNHPDGVLRPDDFVCIKANWQPKDMNVSEIAKELNILPESIVFVDDNPAEREIVSKQLGVCAPEIGSVEDYIRVIDRSGFFEVTQLSKDDLQRNDMYIANAKRAKQQASFENYGDYLKSLEMTAYIGDFQPVYLQRITQLTNKSNQFNVTTKRYTQAQMQEVFESDRYIRLFGRLTDKFGDNGVVSVVIGEKKGNELHIDLWLMSCRVLKRDMELAMLDVLVKKCREQGIEKIVGYYYPTAKNKMVRELFGSFGFEKISEDESGNTVWEMNVSAYEDKCVYIDIKDSEDKKGEVTYA